MKNRIMNILKWWKLRRVRVMTEASTQVIKIKPTDVLVVSYDVRISPFAVETAVKEIKELNLCRHVLAVREGIKLGVIETVGV